MMEPLVGFYILLGLFFDIIGAFLIVSNIITFRSSWTPELLKINSEWLAQYRKFLPTMSQIIIADNEKESLKKFQEENKDLLKASNDYNEKLGKEIEKQRKDFSKNRAYSGLSFLIGGFLLQGLGVVVQLF